MRVRVWETMLSADDKGGLTGFCDGSFVRRQSSAGACWLWSEASTRVSLHWISRRLHGGMHKLFHGLGDQGNTGI